MLGIKKKTPEVAQLVTEFTSKFQEVIDVNTTVAETQAALIALAEDRKVTAEKEMIMAQNFITNFEKMVQ